MGGDPHAAYRFARCLQSIYLPAPSRPGAAPTGDGQGFSVFVNSICKSAGTLVALSAGRLYMTPHAELGPIDIQLRKPDEVGEWASGLTPIQALTFLEGQSVRLFKRHFSQLRFDSELGFSTKMAAEVATTATIGLLSPIYSQLDPMRLAEVDRYLRIAAEYGERLGKYNLHPRGLERLLSEYPSHGSVIDRQEAREIFRRVEDPPEQLCEIGEYFRVMADVALDDPNPFVVFANDRLREETDNDAQTDDREGVRHSSEEEPTARARTGPGKRSTTPPISIVE